MPDNYRHLTRFRKFDPIIQLANWGPISDLRAKLSERKLFPFVCRTFTDTLLEVLMLIEKFGTFFIFGTKMEQKWWKHALKRCQIAPLIRQFYQII